MDLILAFVVIILAFILGLVSNGKINIAIAVALLAIPAYYVSKEIKKTELSKIVVQHNATQDGYRNIITQCDNIVFTKDTLKKAK